MIDLKKLLTKLINNQIVTQNFSTPAVSITSGTAGTYATLKTVDISKSGYNPVGISLHGLGHPGSYNCAVSLSGNYANFVYYRAMSSAYSVPAGDVVATVFYKPQ